MYLQYLQFACHLCVINLFLFFLKRINKVIFICNNVLFSQMPPVEPFIMDSLSLQLTGGPQGYRVSLKNMEIFGASNYTVKDIKLSKNNEPFEASVTMPRLIIRAKYSSSGVLLIIPASGSGDFDATLGTFFGNQIDSIYTYSNIFHVTQTGWLPI